MDAATVGAVIVAVLGILTTILQTMGKAAEARKALAARELAQVIAAGVEAAGDKAVKDKIQAVATDTGTQEKLHALLVAMGYAKPVPAP